MGHLPSHTQRHLSKDMLDSGTGPGPFPIAFFCRIREGMLAISFSCILLLYPTAFRKLSNILL